MDKKKDDMPEDGLLFQQAMDGVKPLTKPASATLETRATSTTVRRRPRPPATSDTHAHHVSDDHASIDAEDGSQHRKNGVQKRVMQKLKRGQFRPGDQLDLHQMNAVTAAAVLLEFVAQSRADSLQCIRIIHGKGRHSKQGPVLKVMTRRMLKDHPKVMAFSACKPADGGDGATDVLLKA